MAIPPLEEIENGIHYKYWNCPVHLIPKSVYSFIAIYKYYKDFPGASMPSINNVSKKFFMAYQYYEQKSQEFREQLL
jgi:hypothetical protein